MDPLIWLGIATFFNLVLVVYVAVWVFRTIDEIRAESRRAAEIAGKVRAEWDEFNRTQGSKIQEKLTEVDSRARTLEEHTGNRLQEFESGVTDTRIELQRLERYLRDVFEVELKNVFDSFDQTVSSVLDEMKNQLLTGVDRIDEIRSLIESRDAVEGRLVEGRSAVHAITTGTSSEGASDDSPIVETGDENKGDIFQFESAEEPVSEGESDSDEEEDDSEEDKEDINP